MRVLLVVFRWRGSGCLTVCGRDHDGLICYVPPVGQYNREQAMHWGCVVSGVVNDERGILCLD